MASSLGAAVVLPHLSFVRRVERNGLGEGRGGGRREQRDQESKPSSAQSQEKW